MAANVAPIPVVAVDTGGTFTDLVVLIGSDVSTLKVPSTPADPSQAVLDGLAQVVEPGSPFVLLHGSTVATNALLERRGAKVALVTNEGFEDVIEIGRQNRPQLYALSGHRLPPLVERSARVGIQGRLGPRGEEVTPLDQAELGELRSRIEALDVDAVAISLLHSYASDEHEGAVAEALAELGVPLSVSSTIVPEFREYERTSTTVINAYVAPKMDTYLGRIAAEAGAEYVSIMGSNGGALPIDRARAEPVHTVLSGPAGGVVGALTWATRAGHPSILSFDMGGTSTDVSLCPGRPLRSREFSIGGQPASIPVIDIHTVGAGGGSIARVDAGGALRVGPQSAGADPGPICYGRGGTEVTVTDAHVWLGRLPVDGFLGGERTLDREAIAGPMSQLAAALGVDEDEAAEGVISIANTAMERALRVISVERGYDPVDFAVVAFGGAGGLHVAELTERLGAPRAIVPPDPGLLSAYGMLASPITREVSRTTLISTENAEIEQILSNTCDALDSAARDALVSEGADASALTSEYWIDARYQGQSFELSVPRDGWVEHYHRMHLERYGYDRRDTPVEAVTVRVVASLPARELAVPEIADGGEPSGTTVSVGVLGERRDASVFRREELGAGARVSGPAVIQEYSGTTWLPPAWTLSVDAIGCLHLTKG